MVEQREEDGRDDERGGDAVFSDGAQEERGVEPREDDDGHAEQGQEVYEVVQPWMRRVSGWRAQEEGVSVPKMW